MYRTTGISRVIVVFADVTVLGQRFPALGTLLGNWGTIGTFLDFITGVNAVLIALEFYSRIGRLAEILEIQAVVKATAARLW